MHTVSQKNFATIHSFITLTNVLADFQNSFTVVFAEIFASRLVLYFPPKLKLAQYERPKLGNSAAFSTMTHA